MTPNVILFSGRRLSELALLYCQKIGDFALSEVGRGCKYLQALHLVDCSNIGDDAMCSIGMGCRNLKKLHIRRCYEVCKVVGYISECSVCYLLHCMISMIFPEIVMSLWLHLLVVQKYILVCYVISFNVAVIRRK